MIVNQTAEYALRAVAYLASLPAGQRARSAEVSEVTTIPNHYLSKVMRKLVVAGICDSKKGHHGGFALTRAAEEISFLEVMRAAEFDPAPDRCAFGLPVCDPQHPCPLHEAWTELNGTFVYWAETTTIADTQAISAAAEAGVSGVTAAKSETQA